MKKFLTLVAFVAIVALVAGTAAVNMPGAWYAGLAKPSWTPPNWVFGPVWSVLYLMIALAGWLVRQQPGTGKVLALWAAQLAANGAWSWLMFGQHMIGAALIDILLVLALIVAFMAAAWPHSRWATYLFVPYLAWVSYATTLNFGVWLLNPRG